MAKVHLIFDNEELDVDKEVLLKFEYFENLFEIAHDNIKIDNIDPRIFKILILLLENETKDVTKDIAVLSDFLGCKTVCKPILEYKCKTSNCNRISLNKTHCELHKCKFEGCYSGSSKSSYCYTHGCQHTGCKDKIIENSRYCVKHKCGSYMCKNIVSSYYNVCKSHIRQCKVPLCPNICSLKKMFGGTFVVYYCEEHTCTFPTCDELSINGSSFCSLTNKFRKECSSNCPCRKCIVCVNHRCTKHMCPNAQLENSQLCQKHTKN